MPRQAEKAFIDAKESGRKLAGDVCLMMRGQRSMHILLPLEIGDKERGKLPWRKILNTLHYNGQDPLQSLLPEVFLRLQ